MKAISNAWFATRTWLIALLAIVPGAATAATVLLFLADWPHPGNRGLQLAVALGVAALVWILAALLFGPELTDVETASSDSYEDLRGRVLTLGARIRVLQTSHDRPPNGGGGLEEPTALLKTLKNDLRLNGHHGRTYGTRWLLGHGYVNAWRELHAAEDRLLVVDDPKLALSRLCEEDFAALERRIHPDRGRPTVAEFEAQGGRELVSRQLALLHKAENDAWDKIVNHRNRLMLTLVCAGTLVYAVLVLAVLRDVSAEMMTAGVAFYLVGAVVGVFNELYNSSRPTRAGSVFDYGLGHVRLLVTPVLSGLAGLGGVLITTMTGPFLVGASGSAAVPDISAVFSLETYGMGLIVAAIFGLTPGLLFTRLRDRTDAYKQEIEQAAPGSPAAKSAAPGKAPPIPVGG